MLLYDGDVLLLIIVWFQSVHFSTSFHSVYLLDLLSKH